MQNVTETGYTAAKFTVFEGNQQRKHHVYASTWIYKQGIINVATDKIIAVALPALQVSQPVCKQLAFAKYYSAKGKNGYLSLTASCHLCNFAVSFSWNPYILGRYRSAFNATLAVLITSPTLPSTSMGSSLPRLLFDVPSSPVRPTSLGPIFGGISVGYTRKRR